MANTPSQFLKNPKRKTARAKTVTMSPEAKRAYEALMAERDERDKTYTRHLPPDSTRR